MARKFTARGEIDIKSDDSDVTRTEGRLRKFGDYLKRSFVITLGDVTRGIRSMVRGLGSIVDAAAAQEDAVKKQAKSQTCHLLQYSLRFRRALDTIICYWHSLIPLLSHR